LGYHPLFSLTIKILQDLSKYFL